MPGPRALDRPRLEEQARSVDAMPTFSGAWAEAKRGSDLGKRASIDQLKMQTPRSKVKGK